VNTANPEPEKVFESGAKRSAKQPRYDLIPTEGLRRLAERYALGTKYGEWNWARGVSDAEFVNDMFNHTIAHLLLARDKFLHARMTNDGDDDLAAAAFGCFGLMEAQKVQGWSNTTSNG
jgi:hypothetical protein